MFNPLGRKKFINFLEHSSFRVWTTQVSNLIRSPHFRNSASVKTKRVAYAIDIPENISRFHPYTFNSTLLNFTLVPPRLDQVAQTEKGFHPGGPGASVHPAPP